MEAERVRVKSSRQGHEITRDGEELLWIDDYSITVNREKRHFYCMTGDGFPITPSAAHQLLIRRADAVDYENKTIPEHYRRRGVPEKTIFKGPHSTIVKQETAS